MAIDWRRILQRIAILALYGMAFTLLRLTSASWATHKLFSVWFPAAGLRFAFLWIAGPRWTVAAAAAELLVSVGAGTVALGADLLLSLIGVVGPCLVYGGVIGVVKARVRGQGGSGALDPLTLAMAAILGPMAASVAALPWALPLSFERGHIDAALLFSSLLVFTLGDLLGILIIAPPAIWLSERVRVGRWPLKIRRAAMARLLELVTILSCAWALVWLLRRLGDGLVLAPVLLAACWCGLRGGRAIAWGAILVTAVVVLPITAGATDALRVQLHMQLACVAVGAYLAGSYADAQAQALLEIDRRDRLLLRAERLKTLRAMSVAVIHEVSQPLSTIAIEAKAMVDASSAMEPNIPEIRDIASLISRKADDLAELIRRLRAFGSGGSDDRVLQSVPKLIGDVVVMVEPEARAVAVTIASAGGPDVAASVNDVEIRQALLNLIRNAIAAVPKPNGLVTLGWSQVDGSVRFWVENEVGEGRRSHNGMGLGLIIARTIAQAHGGGVSIGATAEGVRATLDVPVDESGDV